MLFPLPLKTGLKYNRFYIIVITIKLTSSMKKSKFTYFILLSFTVCLCAGSHAFADKLILTGHKVLKGKLKSYKNGVFYFQTTGGDVIRYPASIVTEFISDDSESSVEKSKHQEDEDPFATPQSTFRKWREAAASGDLGELSRCYTSAYRQIFLDSIKGMDSEKLKRMEKEARETKFELAAPLIQGNKAFMKVTRRYKGKEKQDIISFVREADGWKIEPD